MLVSVIITSYNYQQYIKDTINSVKNQTFKDWELIVIDDASTDSSVEIIKETAQNDSRIKLIVNSENLGLKKSIQKALENAAGEWIAFLESDDEFLPESIEEKIKAAKLGADFIYTDVELFQDKDRKKELELYFKNINKYLVELDHSKFIDDFPKIITKSNIIPTFSCVMVKKELLLNAKFNPLCKSSLDHYLWAQLSDKRVYYINKKLTKWRLHKDSYINKNKNNWFINFLFRICIYSETVKDKFMLTRIILILNYIRTRFIYLKFSKKHIKISLLNDKFIFEKILH